MEKQIQNYQSCLTRKALGVRTQHMAKDGTVVEVWVLHGTLTMVNSVQVGETI